jgi:hypothetical protein
MLRWELKTTYPRLAGKGRPNERGAIIPIRHHGRLDSFSNHVGLALAVCANLRARQSSGQPRLLVNLERYDPQIADDD